MYDDVYGRERIWGRFARPLDLDTMILAFHFAVARESRVLAAPGCGFIGAARRAGVSGIDKLLWDCS